jgi:spore coat protein CotH/PKD repeat protein
MKKTLLLLLTLFFGLPVIFSQKTGQKIFDNSFVHTIHLEFKQEGFWDSLLVNFEKGEEETVSSEEGGEASIPGPIPYLLGNVTIDGQLIDSVGIRIKGFTSADAMTKKPFKIDFNEFVKGKSYDGLKKLNLNNATDDPSMQRDIICYSLFRNIGIPAPRTSFSELYINGKYWGIYQNIEQVDKTFLKGNFSNSKGNLFKNKGWNKLEWEGRADSLYHPPYVLKTNKKNPDWSGFVNFIDVLNNTPDANFEKAIQEVFDVDSYLKILAVDVATANWDSYVEHGRNWYLYEDIKAKKFYWLPWDYNFALGTGLNGGDDGSPDGGDGGGDSGFPDGGDGGFPDGGDQGGDGGFSNVNCEDLSINFFFDVEDSLNVIFFTPIEPFGFSQISWDFGDGNTASKVFNQHQYEEAGTYEVCLTIALIDTCKKTICKTIDTRMMDTGTNCTSLNGANAPQKDVFFKAVVDFNPNCCNEWSANCESEYQNLKFLVDTTDTIIGGGGGINLKVDQQMNEGVLIKRLLSVTVFRERYYQYFCDLLAHHFTEEKMFSLMDKNAPLIAAAVKRDTNFLSSYKAFQEDIGLVSDTLGLKSIITKRLEVLKAELDSLYNCKVSENIPYQALTINELMASNDSTSTIKDADGEYEDWIELYNTTDAAIDLSNVYLTDNFDKKAFWQFPAGTKIEANAYLIVWADKDETQAGLHANFKLKKDGERLMLSNADGSIIDSLSFGKQKTNIAYARIPNGKGPFVFQTATFGTKNDLISSVNTVDKGLSATLYPNPARNILNIDIQDKGSHSSYQIQIFSTTGQLLFTQKQNTNQFQVPLNNWDAGFYILNITNSEGNAFNRKFIVVK